MTSRYHRRTAAPPAPDPPRVVPITEQYKRPELWPKFQPLLGLDDFDYLASDKASLERALSMLRLGVACNLDFDQLEQIDLLRVYTGMFAERLERLHAFALSRARLSDPPWTPDAHMRCCLAVRRTAATLTTLRTFGEVPGLSDLSNELLFLIFWFL